METEKKKILVRMTNWVGDCLIATPALRLLRKTYPSAHIAILVKESLAPLFQGNPYLDEIFPFHPKGFLWRLKLAKRLRGYDQAYIFPRSWDSALIPFLAKIPERTGYANQGRGMLLTRSVKKGIAGKGQHQSEAYKLLIGNDPLIENRADFFLTQDEEKWGREILKDKNTIGIAPGAAYGSAKMWLPERYIELAQRLLSDPKKNVIFFGGPKEAAWMNERVSVLSSRVLNFAGKTSLRQLGALMKACALIVSNDSGPMHVAAAVGTPLVALFGSTCYENTHPLGEHLLIHKRVKCSPCLLRHCPIDHRCMKQISVDEVYKTIVNKLGLEP